jgi:diguanylate cyclase (GGDEF)-like protein
LQETSQPEIDTIEEIEISLRTGLNRLRFEPQLEELYQHDHALSSARHVRFAAIFGLIVYGVFGLLDWTMVGVAFSKLALVRYGLVSPVIIFCIFLLKLPRIHLYLFKILSTVLLFIASTLVGMTMISGEHITILGVLPLVMFIFTGLRLSFRQSNIVCWIIFIMALIAGLHLQNQADGLPMDFFRFVFLFALINVLGMFCAYTLERHRRKDFLQTHLLELEAQQLEALGEQLMLLSTTDSLTELANRRYFQERYDEEWRRASRDGTPISLLLLDVDEFKAFNDNYGHQAGDRCLASLGRLLKTMARRSGEVAARYGGEEFILLVPRVSHEEALQLGQSLCESVRELSIPHGHSRAAKVVTASVGVATCIPGPDVAPRELVSLADKCLYQAKDRGRDTCVAEDKAA